MPSAAQKRNLIKAKKVAWLANLKKHAIKARTTLQSAAARCPKTMSFTIPERAYNIIQQGEGLISLNDDKVSAIVHQCGTDIDPHKHLRTIDFTLPGRATVKILEKQASNLDVLFEGDKHAKGKFVRISLVIPVKSQPAYGTSRLFTYKSDGHRLVPAIPMKFKDMWEGKAKGYAKYGPIFYQHLKSFKASKHPLSKATLKTKGKKVTFHLPNKTAEVKGGDKLVVRGCDFHVRNCQRQQILFQKKQPNNELLMESIDGYVEDVVWKAHHLQVTMLVPWKEDHHALAHPFGKPHPPPAKFHHHHTCYSRLWNVHPMTGEELVKLAGNGVMSLPPGSIMSTSLIGISAASIAAVGGVIAATGGATAGIIKACKD